MSEHISKERVLEALKGVKGPNLAEDIVSLGLVSEVIIKGGKVYFAISVDPARARELEALRQAAETAVKDLPGVDGVAVTLTADRAPGGPAPGGNGSGGGGRHRTTPRLRPARRSPPVTGPAQFPA